MVTSTPKNHVVELTKFAPLLLAELTGIWSLPWGGTRLRMLTFNTSTDRLGVETTDGQRIMESMVTGVTNRMSLAVPSQSMQFLPIKGFRSSTKITGLRGLYSTHPGEHNR